ncbi:hypothetical protein [Pontibacter rugosus]|uniref:Lipoprotein n=1 Tax=Pontibacter rugosus TaxID=1745966 RepID=A0ABW3SPW4_9BACT
MRKLLYLLILFGIFSCENGPSSQSVEGSTPTGETDTTAEVTTVIPDTAHVLENVGDIKREYDSIVSRAETNSMDSSFFNYDCNGERLGRVVYFSDEQGLRLIRHTYSEYSHFSATEEYFLKGGSLFFVLYNQTSWRFEGEGKTRDDVTEKRFYILGGKAVKCLEKKFSVKSPASVNALSPMAENTDTDCASLEDVKVKFELLNKYRGREKYPECLEE